MGISMKCLVALALFALIAESFGYGYSSGYRRGGYEKGRGRSRGGKGRGYFNTNSCELTLGTRYNRHPKYQHIRTIPSSCEKGHVDWHYPKGRVSLDFSDYWGTSQPFTICLEEQGSAATHNITDVTDGYYLTKYNFKRPDQWSDGHVCIPSHGPRLRLVLDGGPRVTYYMTRLYYTKEGQGYGVTTTTGTTTPTPEPEFKGESTKKPFSRWAFERSEHGSSNGGYGSYGHNYPKA